MTQEEYERIADTYVDMVFRTALSYAKAKEDAEDATQNTFLRLLKCKEDFQSEEHIRRWLLHVAVNECKRIWGSAWRKKVEFADRTDELPAFEKEDFVSNGEKTKVKNEVRIDVKNGKNELVANKESMTRDGNTVTFYSQIDITEWDYWNYMKEYALKDELIFPKVSSVIPEGFSYKKEDSDTSYMLIEGLDKELNRTDSMLQEAEDGKSAGVKFHIIVTDSEAENGIIAGDTGENQINSKEAMRFDVQKVWSGKEGEICYRERVNPYMKQETYKDVKDIEETTIDGNRAYLIKKENGCVCARIYKKARIVTISIDIGSEKKAMKLLEQIVGEK